MDCGCGVSFSFHDSHGSESLNGYPHVRRTGRELQAGPGDGNAQGGPVAGELAGPVHLGTHGAGEGRAGTSVGGEHDGPFGRRKKREQAETGHLGTIDARCEVARVAGRVASMRGHGKLWFVTVEDASGAVQLMFQAGHLPADAAAVEDLIVAAARGAAGRIEFDFAGQRVDLTPPWPRRDLLDMLADRLGRRVHPSMPVQHLRQICEANGVPYLASWGSGKLIFELYDKVLMPQTVGPVFIYHYPTEVSPLARQSLEDPTVTDRFELVIGGRELANGYSELNDPDEQARRFRPRRRRPPEATPRPTRPTPPSCGRSSSGCRRRPASASASTG
jgi:lysyl-tRNA synthetase class II